MISVIDIAMFYYDSLEQNRSKHTYTQVKYMYILSLFNYPSIPKIYDLDIPQILLYTRCNKTFCEFIEFVSSSEKEL